MAKKKKLRELTIDDIGREVVLRGPGVNVLAGELTNFNVGLDSVQAAIAGLLPATNDPDWEIEFVDE